jgi:hypothetical protein
MLPPEIIPGRVVQACWADLANDPRAAIALPRHPGWSIARRSPNDQYRRCQRRGAVQTGLRIEPPVPATEVELEKCGHAKSGGPESTCPGGSAQFEDKTP